MVRQDLSREHSIRVSLRTVERAVKGYRRELAALPRATVRFEAPPGKQLQVDFGETRIAIGEERPKVFLFVASLGYSRRPYVARLRGRRAGSQAWRAPSGTLTGFRRRRTPSAQGIDTKSVRKTCFADALARARQCDIVDTHPDHPAFPSGTDRAQSWDGGSYLILAVNARGVWAIRSWRLSGRDFAEEEEVC